MPSSDGPFRFKVITLERTPCYGTCPVYRVRVDANGLVKYVGVEYVKTIGRHSWKISENAVRKLDQLIEKFDYFGLQAREPKTQWTDCPWCVTSVRMADGRFRKIENYYGARIWPASLRRFEASVEVAIGIRRIIRLDYPEGA